MQKIGKKHTNSIDNVEEMLNIKYPEVIRKKLERENGFTWGEFEFYPIQDVKKENDMLDIPNGYVCIAHSVLEWLLLNENKDGKIYYYLPGHNAFEEVFENTESLVRMLEENAIRLKLSKPTNEKYFIELMLYAEYKDKQLSLAFHAQPELKNTNERQTYCSEVNPGQRLSEVLEKEIKQISGHKEYNLDVIYSDGTAQDAQGRELVRYGLVIQISYFETKGKRFRESYMSWIENPKPTPKSKR